MSDSNIGRGNLVTTVVNPAKKIVNLSENELTDDLFQFTVENGIFYINGIETDPEEFVDNISQYVLNFCGCGMPHDAMGFYYTQLKALAEGKDEDYIGITGGLEFFKLVMFFQKLWDGEKGEISKRGKLINSVLTLLVGNNLIEVELPTLPESQFKLTTMDFTDEMKSGALSFWSHENWDEPGLIDPLSPPTGIDITSASLYFFHLVSFVTFKNSVELKDVDSSTRAGWSKMYEVKKRVDAEIYPFQYGAEYWSWYMIDWLGFEEHGGSSPGWLPHDPEVIAMYSVLTKVFFDLDYVHPVAEYVKSNLYLDKSDIDNYIDDCPEFTVVIEKIKKTLSPGGLIINTESGVKLLEV